MSVLPMPHLRPSGTCPDGLRDTRTLVRSSVERAIRGPRRQAVWRQPAILRSAP